MIDIKIKINLILSFLFFVKMKFILVESLA